MGKMIPGLKGKDLRNLTLWSLLSGATIDADLVTPYLPTVLSLKDQVNQFLASLSSHPKTAPWTSANSLFSFFIGINDIGRS